MQCAQGFEPQNDHVCAAYIPDPTVVYSSTYDQSNKLGQEAVFKSKTLHGAAAKMCGRKFLTNLSNLLNLLFNVSASYSSFKLLK